MSDEANIKQLISHLKVGSKDQKLAAVEELANIGQAVIQPLLDLVLHSDADIKQQVLESLWWERSAIYEEIISKDGFRLLTHTTDADLWYVFAVLEIMGRLGKEAVAPLLLLLSDPYLFSQCWAALALSEARSLDALESLTVAARSENIDLAKSAVMALGKLESKKATPVLLSLLESLDRDLRSSVLIALYQIKDSSATEALIPLLEHEDMGTRSEAATTLGQTRDARAVEPLIALLRRCGPEVYAASAALYCIGEASVEPMISLLSDPKVSSIYDLVIMDLSFIGDIRAVEPIIKMLNNKNERARQSAIPALGRFKQTSAVEPLIQQMESYRPRPEYSPIPGGIAQALGEIGNDRAVDYLISLLNHPDRNIRQSAVMGLGNAVASERATDNLIETLQSGPPDVRPTAAGALGNLGSANAVEPLIEAMQSASDSATQQFAAGALCKIGGEQALAALRSALVSHPNEFVRREIGWRLNQPDGEE